METTQDAVIVEALCNVINPVQEQRSESGSFRWYPEGSGSCGASGVEERTSEDQELTSGPDGSKPRSHAPAASCPAASLRHSANTPVAAILLGEINFSLHQEEILNDSLSLG